MSLIEPRIDDLLEKTDGDRYLLSSIAYHRAHDINEMLRGQRKRAIDLDDAVDIAKASTRKPLAIAFDEIANGTVSYDPATIDARRH